MSGPARSAAPLPEPVTAPDMTLQRQGGAPVDYDEEEGGQSPDDGEIYLPPGCPVTALGIMGQKIYFLDVSNQLMGVTTECRKNDLALWFGGERWLMSHNQFVQWKPSKGNEPPTKDGFNQKYVSLALVNSCRRKGIFNPEGRVFGRGAHRQSDDPDCLVLHMGRSVMIANEADKKGKRQPAPYVRAAGAIKDSFYPADGALMPPADMPSTPQDAEALMDLFGKWYFMDPEVAVILLLGFFGQAQICGAMTWRAHIWLTGPTAAGKSFLQRLLRTMLANWCLHTEDATEAGIRQKLNGDTLVVLLDEAEADDNADRQKAIVNLARKSSSGGTMYRGATDHKSKEFVAQSAFLFSSILHSPLQGQDRNRMAILEMRQVPPKQRLEIDWEFWRRKGREFQRRMIDQWGRFEDTLSLYKREINDAGFTGRWGDTYGTLLTCADMLLYDVSPARESMANDGYGREKRWVAMLVPMMTRAAAEARTDVERCLHYLATAMLPGSGGQPPEPVARWIQKAMTPIIPDTLAEPQINKKAREKLKAHGLRVAGLKRNGTDGNGRPTFGAVEPEKGEGQWLLIGSAGNRALMDIFKAPCEWHSGGWLQSLGKVENAERGVKSRFYGSPENAIAVPLEAILGKGWNVGDGDGDGGA